MKKAKINILGMHCASCASNLEKSLVKVKGVKKVNTLLLLKKCIVECEDFVKPDDLKQAIARAGYKLGGEIIFE